MTDKSGSTLVLALDSDTGDVEWFHHTAGITLQQAMVIGHIRGLSKIAAAIDHLASAVDAVADNMRHPDDA